MKKIRAAMRFLFQYGPANFIFRVFNRFKTWDLPQTNFSHSRGTSITDSDNHLSYLTFCSTVQVESKEFKKFRSNKSIISVYDHVPLSVGIEYLSEIERIRLGAGSTLDWKLVSRLDSIGNPLKYHFSGIGNISPTFLRYTKTILELEDFFDTNSFRNICEIGVGFGGQAALILERWKPDRYTFYDLPEVLHLVEKYLIEVDARKVSETILRDGRNPKSGQYDFVFSNYAFSELDKVTQDAYLNNVILNSRHGYITWNNLGHHYNDAHSLGELIRLIPNSQIMPEIPLTSKYNSVITW